MLLSVSCLKSYGTPNNKCLPKWFIPYWIAIFVLTIILGAVVLPFFQHVPIENAIFITVVFLLFLTLAFYDRIKPLSQNKNRIIYIGLVGAAIGCWLSIAAIAFISRIDSQIDVFTVSVLVGCFIIGGIIGDLIGKARHYKGPAQYSP